MIVTPLSVRSPSAVRVALLSHGWEGDLASVSSGGLGLAAFHVTGVSHSTLEAMVPVAGRLGLELVTGDEWLLLLGPRSRLGAFARPWVQPADVQQLAHAIGVAMAGDRVLTWPVAGYTVALDSPVLIGVINVTPDSFDPASRATNPDAVLRLAERLIGGGARILDVGGESTRPGAIPVDPADEWERIEPALQVLRRHYPEIPLSIDSVNASTAERAMDAGAAILNDVTAGRHDPRLLEVAANTGAGLVLSHSRGPLDRIARYDEADYEGDVVSGVARELQVAIAAAGARGVATDQLVVDPGFGFSKTPPQNWQLLDSLDAIVALGRPVLAAVSRKRFLGDATGQPIESRDPATAAACVLAADRGAQLFRVHSPGAVRDALAVAAACRGTE